MLCIFILEVILPALELDTTFLNTETRKEYQKEKHIHINKGIFVFRIYIQRIFMLHCRELKGAVGLLKISLTQPPGHCPEL